MWDILNASCRGVRDKSRKRLRSSFKMSRSRWLKRLSEITCPAAILLFG
jgi:hypothetical protein